MAHNYSNFENAPYFCIGQAKVILGLAPLREDHPTLFSAPSAFQRLAFGTSVGRVDG